MPFVEVDGREVAQFNLWLIADYAELVDVYWTLSRVGVPIPTRRFRLQSDDSHFNPHEELLARIAETIDGPAMFSTDWPETTTWSDEMVKIEEVLYFFDKPMMFTTRSGPFTLLFQAWDEDDGMNLYTVSVVDEGILSMLHENRLSVRGAVAGDMRFMVDFDGERVLKVWRVRRWNIPDRRKPGAGACLSDCHARGREDLVRVFVAIGGDGVETTATVDVREPGFDLQMSPSAETVDRLVEVLSGISRRIAR
jgi:hypothetical protein